MAKGTVLDCAFLYNYPLFNLHEMVYSNTKWYIQLGGLPWR